MIDSFKQRMSDSSRRLKLLPVVGTFPSPTFVQSDRESVPLIDSFSGLEILEEKIFSQILDTFSKFEHPFEQGKHGEELS